MLNSVHKSKQKNTLTALSSAYHDVLILVCYMELLAYTYYFEFIVYYCQLEITVFDSLINSPSVGNTLK